MRAIQRFGKQLQRLRTRRGLTQEQLAVIAGLSRTFVMRLELGQHDPSLSTLVRLAKALRVSVTELLGESVSASQWWQVGEARFATRRMPRITPVPRVRCLSHGIRTNPEARCAVSSLFAGRNSPLRERGSKTGTLYVSCRVCERLVPFSLPGVG